MTQKDSEQGSVVGRGWHWVMDQFGAIPLLNDYFIPEETNNFWYALGGVLALAFLLEIITGVILTLKYVPDAALAYGIISGMLQSPWWRVVLSIHYYNAILIFGLIITHLMRVFLSAAYRGDKKGLWFVGVFLGGLTFAAYVTGETLHWDEVGFAVPWHIHEFFEAVGLADALHYTVTDITTITTATTKLAQIYAVHVAILPIALITLIGLHFYLIKDKGISVPFWKEASGNMVPFKTHIREWAIYGTAILGIIVLLAIFVGRGPGTAPQLLPSSPLHNQGVEPGEVAKPTTPIGWTHGMNIFVSKYLGLEPDIWGTVLAGAIIFFTILAIPFVDRDTDEPRDWQDVFDWRTRKWAFLLIIVFWLVVLIGIVQNLVAGPG